MTAKSFPSIVMMKAVKNLITNIIFVKISPWMGLLISLNSISKQINNFWGRCSTLRTHSWMTSLRKGKKLSKGCPLGTFKKNIKRLLKKSIGREMENIWRENRRINSSKNSYFWAKPKIMLMFSCKSLQLLLKKPSRMSQLQRKLLWMSIWPR